MTLHLKLALAACLFAGIASQNQVGLDLLQHRDAGAAVVAGDGARLLLARVIQLEKRGAVLGDRTAGAVMTARLFPHAFGIGSVSFYATSITIGDVRMSDGGSLEKVGVTPDETVLPTGADLAAGRDPVLARAIALLGGTMTAEQAGTFYRR